MKKKKKEHWQIKNEIHFFPGKINIFYMSLTSLPNQTPEQEVTKR